MALIVEDGSLVASANSYVSLVDIKAYAVNRGVTLGADSVIEAQSRKAIDYLEGKRSEYQGNKITYNQALQFPRYNLYIDDFEFPYDAIPNELKNAQCQLIIEQSLGVNILPTQSDPAVKSETIGPIKTEYAVNAGSLFEPHLLSVDLLLKPLFKTASSGFSLNVVRI